MSAADGGLSIAVASVGGEVFVTVCGEIDVATGPCLGEALQAALSERPARIVVDFTGVSFCDCCGLGVLLTARRRACRAGIDFQVTGVTAPSVVKLIRLFGLAEVLGVKRRPAT